MIWEPTLQLRILREFGRLEIETRDSFQQLWQSKCGKKEWRDVEVVEHPIKYRHLNNVQRP